MGKTKNAWIFWRETDAQSNSAGPSTPDPASSPKGSQALNLPSQEQDPTHHHEIIDHTPLLRTVSPPSLAFVVFKSGPLASSWGVHANKRAKKTNHLTRVAQGPNEVPATRLSPCG